MPGGAGLHSSVQRSLSGRVKKGVLGKAPSRVLGSHAHQELSRTQVTQNHLLPDARHVFATVDGAAPAALGQWAPLATAIGPARRTN